MNKTYLKYEHLIHLQCAKFTGELAGVKEYIRYSKVTKLRNPKIMGLAERILLATVKLIDEIGKENKSGLFSESEYKLLLKDIQKDKEYLLDEILLLLRAVRSI